MKFSRLCLVALSLAAALSISGCDDKKTNAAAPQAPAAAKTYNVGVIQLVEHQALDAANKGFVDGLASRGFIQGKNIKFDFQNAQADQSNLRNIATRFVGNKVDLIGAIATPAAQTMANATQKTPIVATAVTDFEMAKLVKSNEKPGTNVTGSSDLTPTSSVMELILKFYPNTKSIGTMYSSSEVNSEQQVGLFKKEAEKRGISVREATVSSVNDIQQAAKSLIGKVDLLYVPTDNTIASAIPALIKVTEPAKLPVFAGEGFMVRNGATAALAVDYYELGKQAGIMAADILEGKGSPENMPIQHQKEFKTLLNETSVKNLGINVPSDLKAEIVK